jgi:hypothetical protein
MAKVYVVQELVGEWEDCLVANLVGVYTTLDSAETACKEYVKTLSAEILEDVCGYEIAIMNILDNGYSFDYVYCSIYHSLDDLI